MTKHLLLLRFSQKWSGSIFAAHAFVLDENLMAEPAITNQPVRNSALIGVPEHMGILECEDLWT